MNVVDAYSLRNEWVSAYEKRDEDVDAVDAYSLRNEWVSAYE